MRLGALRAARLWASGILLLAIACADGKGVAPPPDPGPTIGFAGGTVASSSGVASVSIPTAALLEEVPVAVEAYVPPFPDDNVLLPSVHMIHPPAVVLAVPATISLDYEAEDLLGRPQRGLRIERWGGAQWTPVSSNAVLDSTARRLSAATSQFGLFAIRSNPCVPWDVTLAAPIVGVTSTTDCPILINAAAGFAFTDMYEVTLLEQTAFTLVAEAPYSASLHFSAPDAATAPAIATRSQPGWKESTFRAILSPGRYQLHAAGVSALGLGVQHTFTPTVRTAAQTIENVECDFGGVVIVAGVTVSESVSSADCEDRLWPGFTSDVAATNATGYSHPFFVALRGGDSLTVTVTGSSPAANVGLVADIGPVETKYLDHPDSTSQSVTLTSSTAASFRVRVRVHGRAVNAYEFPGPTPYTLTVTSPAATPAASPRPSP